MAAVEVAEESRFLRLSGHYESVCGLVYIPTIDVVVVSTKEGRLSVYDAYSWSLLLDTRVSTNPLSCVYHSYVDKLLSTDGRCFGARRDLDGVIFVPTLLQPYCLNSEEVVLEIPASEGVEYCRAVERATEDGKVLQSTKEQVLFTSLKENVKLLTGPDHEDTVPGTRPSWEFVEIRGQLSALQSSLSDLNQKIGPVSLHHHLWTRSILLDKDGDSEKIRCVDGGLVGTDSLITVPNTFNILEAYRRATLLDWPHKKHKWATPPTLAAAGFYKNTKSDSSAMFNNAISDLVTCFQCQKSLRSWEATDEPWSEHTRHFAECPFVSRQWTNNVPLSVTMATTPAVTMTTSGSGCPTLSTSWGCPYVGVTWENGTIAIYDVGKCLYTHEVCAPIQLSAEGLSQSLHFDEIVRSRNDFSEQKESEDLEQALDGIKATLADLPHNQDPIPTDSDLPLAADEGMSVTLDACCVICSEKLPSTPDKQPVLPSVMVGCAVTTPTGTAPLIISHFLKPLELEKNGGQIPHHAVAQLHKITRLPLPELPASEMLKPAIKGIIPTCEGRYLVVNLLYYSPSTTSLPKEVDTNGAPLDESGTETLGASTRSASTSQGLQQVTGGQIVVFQVSSKTFSHSRVTCILNNPVTSKTTSSPETSIVSLCALTSAHSISTGPSPMEGLMLAGLTTTGGIQFLDGRDLTVIKELTLTAPSGEPDVVVKCLPCSNRHQLLVLTASNAVRFVDAPHFSHQVEETDNGRSDPTTSTSGWDDFFENFHATHSWLTSVGSEGVSFLSRPPPAWEEVSPEERDKDLPQHVHTSDSTKNGFTKSWIIARNSQDQVSRAMVLELTKPSQSNLGMLKVLLSSNTPQLLEGARVTLLASSQEDRDNHYSCVAQQPSMEKGNDQDNHTPVVTEIDDRPSYESVLPEHLPQKPTSALPDSVRAACRSHHACVIAGPVQCKDVCGLMKLSASFSLFHPSLGVPGLQRYLLLVELNVEGTTGEESSSTKGKSPLTLTVSFHQLQAQPPKNYKSFVSLRVSTTFIQQLALTACRLRVREEEFSGLCVEAREWLESSHVRSHVLSEEDRFKAVELLCILAGRLLFIHSSDAKTSFLSSLSPVLRTLSHQCFLFGTRQTSYKCLRLLKLCQRIEASLSPGTSGRGSPECGGTFSSQLQLALLDNVKLVPMATLAVGIRNMFDLIGSGVGVADLQPAISILMDFCGHVMDCVENINVIPPLKGLFGVETSIINLNYEQYMFDGGLPSLPCLTADSSHKPTLEYSSQNHNNEMILFCKGSGTPATSRNEGSISFSDMFFSGSGDRDKRPIELVCESMKMAPFLRQPQVGGLDSLELQYTIKGFTQTVPSQSVKVSPRLPSQLPSKKSGGPSLLYTALQPRLYADGDVPGQQEIHWIEEMLSVDVARQVCSRDSHDESVMKVQMDALEDNLLHFGHGSGRRMVELSSVRSGQAFAAILDFRLPVRLTDVCIPANSMLSSVSVDVWLTDDQQPVRIVHSKDLATKSVAIGNLSPPPLCQYAKVMFGVGIGKGVPMLMVDLGLYCGRPEMSLLAPEVALKLNSLTKQVFSSFSELSGQLKSILVHFTNSLPVKSDPVSAKLVKQAKSLVVESGGLQFTLSILKCLRTHIIRGSGPPGSVCLDVQGIMKNSSSLSSSNKWYSIARRLVNKLVCLLQMFREAGLNPPASRLTLTQAKSMFYTLGLQCYPKVSSRAMSVLVETCSRAEWWPAFIKEIISEVTNDQRPLFYTKKRAFSVLSGFISRSSSVDIVSSILDLLEKTLFVSTEEEARHSSPVHLGKKTQAYHWILMVFYESLSSLYARSRNIVLERSQCKAVSRGIVSLITQLLASGCGENKETIVVASKAVLLLSQATRPALRFQDVFTVDTLREYLCQCCSSASTADSIVQTAVESVLFEIFSADCTYARRVLNKEPLPVTVPGVDEEEPAMEVNQSKDPTPHPLPPPPHIMYSNDGDSDEEMLGYLAKKSGLGSASEYQYGQYLMHRYVRRKRKTKVPDTSPSDVEDPPYSSYIISGAVDQRLENTFELQAELDMQMAWKEAYRQTLKFISSCGEFPHPSKPSSQPVVVSPESADLSCVRQNQSLLCTVLAQLSASLKQPFSTLSSGRFTHVLWGLMQATLLSGSKADLTTSVQDHFSFLQRTSEVGIEIGGMDLSHSIWLADVAFLNQLITSTEVLLDVLELLAERSHDRDVFTHGMKMVTVILSARLELKSRCHEDFSTFVDLHLVGRVIQRAVEERGTLLSKEDIQQVFSTLCLFYEEVDPYVNEEVELSIFNLRQSGILVAVEVLSQILKNDITNNQVLVCGSFLSVLECVSKVLNAALMPGGVCQREKTALCMLRSSQLYVKFKKTVTRLFEQFLRILQDGHWQNRKPKVVILTQESPVRRRYDDRQNWVESSQDKRDPLSSVTALGELLHLVVRYECSAAAGRGDDLQSGLWEELIENKQFVTLLLKVFLTTASREGMKRSTLGRILKELLFKVGAIKLICPLTEVLKWCNEREVLLPPLSLLIQDITDNNQALKELFISSLVQAGLLQAVLEGFVKSNHDSLSAEPSVLNLPYIWHLFRSSSKETVQNLSENISKSSPAAKFLLKSGTYLPRHWRKLAEKQECEILEVNFKSPVLLHNVQIHSHNSSGPAAVEVFVRPTKYSPETSESDLLQNFICGSLKVDFREPVLCSDLFLHLWRLPSSSAISLSGIVLMGQTLQSVALSEAASSQEVGDIGNPWLSLLHWWSQQDPGMQSCAKSYLTDHALQLTQGCLHLLQNRSNSVALDLLAELSNVSESLGRQLVIGCLKIGPLGQSSGEYSTVNVLTGEVSLSSAVDLVHTLCHPKTPQGSKRLDIALRMLTESASSSPSLLTPSTLVKALASILWLNSDIALPCLQDHTLVMILVDYCLSLRDTDPQKPTMNSLLCAVCAGEHSVETVKVILERLEKQVSSSPKPHLLSSLAALVQSRTAMSVFLKSSVSEMLLSRLVKSLEELHSDQVVSDNLRSLLSDVELYLIFFAKMAAHTALAKAWLGQSKLRQMWSNILSVAASPINDLLADTEGFHPSSLAEVCFQFFAHVCDNSFQNKVLVTQLLLQVLKKDDTHFTSFHLRLLSDVVLSVESVPVVLEMEVETETGNTAAPSSCSPPTALPLIPSHKSPVFHPVYGAKNGTYLCYAPVAMEIDVFTKSLRDDTSPKSQEKSKEPPKVLTHPLPYDSPSLNFPPPVDEPDLSSAVHKISEGPSMWLSMHDDPPSSVLRRQRVKEPSEKDFSSKGAMHLTLMADNGCKIATPLAMLRFEEVMRALEKSGFHTSDPLCLHFTVTHTFTPSQAQEEYEDEKVSLLISSLQQCFRTKTKPPQMKPGFIVDSGRDTPNTTSALTGIGQQHITPNSFQIFLDGCRNEDLCCILPHLYGSVWPSSSATGDIPTDSLIKSPPRGIPFHSLAMFGLALSLPEFVSFLSRETSLSLEAFILAKVLTGRNLEEVEADLGGSSSSCSDLVTLPYQMLEQALRSAEIENVLEKCYKLGIFQYLLNCMSHLGSYSCRTKDQDSKVKNLLMFQTNWQSRDGSEAALQSNDQEYWAKGTGFGSGSLRSGWNMDQVREKQKKNERQMELIFKILSLTMESTSSPTELTKDLVETISSSCLLPAIASWLTNDSFLDMSLHIPLYLAVFETVGCLGNHPSLVGLLLENPYPSWVNESSSFTIFSLVERMHNTAIHFQKASRIGSSVKTSHNVRDYKVKPSQPTPELDTKTSTREAPPPPGPKPKEAEHHVQKLITSIESVWDMLSLSVAQLRRQQSGEHDSGEVAMAASLTPEEIYMGKMRPLQFDSYELITVEENGRVSCSIPYHYTSKLESSNVPVGGGARVMRITQELTTLANSLPLSASSSVFIRTDEERLDVMKFLITGPSETPYANGCFVFDVFFPPDYPNNPMMVNLETTGYKTVRFNPNLYADGKVCLSVLNTWSGRPEEKWSANTSSMLQVLVSIQSLIFVSEPYFNEPGYERQRGTPQGDDQCLLYNAAVIADNMKWAILEQLANPPKAFRSVVLEHFYLKKSEVLSQCQSWRQMLSEGAQGKPHLTALSTKLKIIDSLLPQIKKKLEELDPENGHFE
jgi:baculoviral IAP repeat-containing protein 6